MMKYILIYFLYCFFIIGIIAIRKDKSGIIEQNILGALSLPAMPVVLILDWLYDTILKKVAKK